MDILNVIRPANAPAIPLGFADLGSQTVDDLDSQQRHREVLLSEADTRIARQTMAGCVSEISIVENIFDSEEFQEVQREIGDLLGNCSLLIDALERPILRRDQELTNYDDCVFFDVAIFEPLRALVCVSDDDIEEFGYMGWLVRS